MKEAPSKFEEENNCKNINVGGRQLNNTFPKKNYVIKRTLDKNTENKTEKKNNEKNNFIQSTIPQYFNPQNKENKVGKKTEYCSILKYSEGIRNYLHFIWELNLTKKEYLNNSIYIKEITGKDSEIYYLGIVYVFFQRYNCSSVIFAFQNGINLNKNEFKNELIIIKNKIINENLNEKKILKENNINEKEEIIEIKDDNEEINNKINNNKISSLYEIYLLNKSIFELDEEEKEINNIKEEEKAESESEELSFNIICNIFCPSISSKITKYLNIKRKKIILSRLNISSKAYINKNYITIIIEEKIQKIENLTTKYNGIINEGMTCYLNSMMQSYNALTLFKKAIFSLPFEKEENSLSSSLQILFYDLTFGNQLVSSNKLINSFGWSKNDIFIQHDIQEFNMMLSDIMEKKFKGTKANETFNYLFEGKTENIIKCIDYDFQSVKEEKFNDIQLNVKGCNNIYESLNEFTKEEILDNEDKYEVEGHGKEKAIKKMKFIHLPPVLMFQLKRFEYNNEINFIEKLNDYYKFEDELNMNNYIEKKNSNEDYKYTLISVVVHKGNVFGGHYYAYINQDIEHKKENWFCFNDENVRKADLFEVFDLNFGGDFSIPKYNEDLNIIEYIKFKSDLSAYILLYIQNSKLNEILIPMKKEDFPKNLEIDILNEKNEEEKKKNEWKQKFLYKYNFYNNDEEEEKKKILPDSPKSINNNNNFNIHFLNHQDSGIYNNDTEVNHLTDYSNDENNNNQIIKNNLFSE